MPLTGLCPPASQLLQVCQVGRGGCSMVAKALMHVSACKGAAWGRGDCRRPLLASAESFSSAETPTGLIWSAVASRCSTHCREA